MCGHSTSRTSKSPLHQAPLWVIRPHCRIVGTSFDADAIFSVPSGMARHSPPRRALRRPGGGPGDPLFSVHRRVQLPGQQKTNWQRWKMATSTLTREWLADRPYVAVCTAITLVLVSVLTLARSSEGKNGVPRLPSAVPYVTNTYHFMTNMRKFLRRSRYEPTVPPSRLHQGHAPFDTTTETTLPGLPKTSSAGTSRPGSRST